VDTVKIPTMMVQTNVKRVAQYRKMIPTPDLDIAFALKTPLVAPVDAVKVIG
jgi:hypothetical protein